MHQAQRLTKCDFCTYKVGNECVVASATGQVPEHRCKQAAYEFSKWEANKWAHQRQYNYNKKKSSWK